MAEQESPSGAEFVRRLQEGDPQAAEELFAQYAQRLARLAAGHLRGGLAGRLDGEDVVQSALRSFFRRCAQGEFHIDSRAQLWRLLVKITLNKARAKARHHTAGLRDAHVEVPDQEALLAEEAAREPGPEETAVLADHVRALLCGLPAIYGEVLHRRLEGYSVAEIASALGVSRQTVYRALELFRHRLIGGAASAGAGNS